MRPLVRQIRRQIRQIPRGLLLLVMLAGWALITASSLAYFDFDELPPFVIEKLPLRFEALWLASLRLHVVAALVSLPLCVALMTRMLQRRPVWHRWLGRIAGVIVLFALVPSGVVLAFDAKGGPVVTAGFLLSAAIVAWSGMRGIAAARRRDLVTHRRMMSHFFAQMSVAVTSRAMLLGLDAMGIDPGLAYVVALWAPVLASAAVAELASSSTTISTSISTTITNLIARIRRICRETSRLARVVRARALARPLAREGR